FTLDEGHFVFWFGLCEKIIYVRFPGSFLSGGCIFSGYHHRTNVHCLRGLEPFAHSTFYVFCYFDYSQDVPVLCDQERSSASTGNIRNALSSLMGNLIAAFRNMFGNCFWRSLADLLSVEVHS